MNDSEQNTNLDVNINKNDYTIPEIADNEIISAPETPSAPDENKNTEIISTSVNESNTNPSNNLETNNNVTKETEEYVDNTKYREIRISKNAPPTTLADALIQSQTRKSKVNSTVVILIILALCIFIFRERLTEFFSTLGQNNQTQK